MKQNCKAKTKRGAPCPNPAGESGFCFTHDPARGVERALARRKGGQRARVPHYADASKLPTNVRTIDDVRAILEYALAECVPMENSVLRGRLLVSIAQAFEQVIKTGELEARLAVIEQALKERDMEE